MNAQLFESTDYLNMHRSPSQVQLNEQLNQNLQQPADDYLNMNRPESDPLANYDPIGPARPINDGPIPKHPMEEVNMIHLSVSSATDLENESRVQTPQVTIQVEDPRGDVMSLNNNQIKHADVHVDPRLVLNPHPLDLQANEYLKMSAMMHPPINVNLDRDPLYKLSNKTMVEVADSVHRL